MPEFPVPRLRPFWLLHQSVSVAPLMLIILSTGKNNTDVELPWVLISFYGDYLLLNLIYPYLWQVVLQKHQISNIKMLKSAFVEICKYFGHSQEPTVIRQRANL